MVGLWCLPVESRLDGEFSKVLLLFCSWIEDGKKFLNWTRRRRVTGNIILDWVIMWFGDRKGFYDRSIQSPGAPFPPANVSISPGSTWRLGAPGHWCHNYFWLERIFLKRRQKDDDPVRIVTIQLLWLSLECQLPRWTIGMDQGETG